QVAGAGDTMKELLTSVQRVTEIVKEISSASEEQSSGIDQVNVAVSQMDEVTQQNAALVEQAAAAAASLQEQARQLAEAVAVFKISANADGVLDMQDSRSQQRLGGASPTDEGADETMNVNLQLASG